MVNIMRWYSPADVTDRAGAMCEPIDPCRFDRRTGGGGDRREHFNMAGRVELQDDFKEQAAWRREKAKQYPDDKRHLEAAAIFDRLAASVDGIPEDVFLVFSECADVDDGLLDVERWAEMLRDVGFQSAPRNAEDLVRCFIADRAVRCE
jgi:hypothetical protein